MDYGSKNKKVIIMKISKSMQDKLNVQIKEELESAYIYMSMAAYFDAESLGGMAKWMKKQAQEEQEHAMKLYSYIYERGGEVEFKDLKATPASWKSPLDVFKAAYEHEMFITGCIDKLIDEAKKDNDKATAGFLIWFIREQVEEEANALDIVEKLKMLGDSKQGLLMYDNVLGKRE